MADAEGTVKKSDLGVRVASAIVMIAVAAAALWLGEWAWTAFVAAVALGMLWEWRALVAGFATSPRSRLLWTIGGLIYVGLAASVLAILRSGSPGFTIVLFIVGSVVATDVGAYFAGRAIGGPKIAPGISPSKTWAGLVGGAIASGLALVGMASITGNSGAVTLLPLYLLVGALIAIVAQAGDFFESWMKRRAGVKDSSQLIPGHGGLLDRVDGLAAVCFVIGLFAIGTIAIELLSGGSLLPTPV